LKTRSELETNWWWTLLHRPLNMRGEITEQMRHDEFERVKMIVHGFCFRLISGLEFFRLRC
jgi:hypothetical protein